jgi:hypothetical protein
VAPALNDVEWAGEMLTGKQLWLAGKRLADCTNDAQRQGWQAADDAGADAYLICLCEAEAAGEFVDWEAVGEVYYNHYGDRVY